MNCKQLQLRTENKRLGRAWLAGAKPGEFLRLMKEPEIEILSVPLLCDEVMRHISQSKKNKKVEFSVSFMELSYIMLGIILIYKSQVAFLFEQVMKQEFSLRSLRITQTTQSLTVWKNSKQADTKKNRARKNGDTTDEPPVKRVKFVDTTGHDWESINQSLNEIEDDDESLIQALQASKVMNRDQISIRDVVPVSDSERFVDSDDGFEAAENVTTQNFLEIRDMVGQGRSLASFLQNENCAPIVTDHDEYPDDESHHLSADDNEFCGFGNGFSDDESVAPTEREYLPLPATERDWIPPPDVEERFGESEVDITHQDGDIEMAPGNDGLSSSIIEVTTPTIPDKNDEQPHTNTSKKRKRRVFDDIRQLPILEYNQKNVRRMQRCDNARLDCVTKSHILRDLRLKYFEKPAKSFEKFHNRYMEDTPSMMVGIRRVTGTKRKEANDRRMVEDFLYSLNGQLPEEEIVHGMSVDQVCEPANEEIQREYHIREVDHTIQDVHDVANHESNDENVPMYESDDAMDVPEPDDEPAPILNHTAAEPHEAILPSVNQSVTMDPKQTTPIAPSQQIQRYIPATDVIPRSVIRILQNFVTVNDAELPLGSQPMSMLKNQQKRHNLGLVGVLGNLFRLWHADTYPIGMKEVIHPSKEKLVAALAFYSIMELNSPRIGLILIEKYEDSNAVYNVAMSPKLVNLLQGNVSLSQRR